MKQRFLDDGYLVLENVLTKFECRDLLAEIVSSFGKVPSMYVHSPQFRVNQSLEMTPAVRHTIKRCLAPVFEPLRSFLRDDFLTELGAITVFPGAPPQLLHADYSCHDERRLVTCFVYPTSVTRETGALTVVPQSHRPSQWLPEVEVLFKEQTKNQVTDARRIFQFASTLMSGFNLFNRLTKVIEVTEGSIVFMDGRLMHFGGANTSCREFRPAFYFSFGANDIVGPTYSLREEYLGTRLSSFDSACLRESESIP